jgi:hypothetical protein
MFLGGLVTNKGKQTIFQYFFTIVFVVNIALGFAVFKPKDPNIFVHHEKSVLTI